MPVSPPYKKPKPRKPPPVTGRHLLVTLRDFRDRLYGLGSNELAEEAEVLLQQVLDGGTRWRKLHPFVDKFVMKAERSLNKRIHHNHKRNTSSTFD